MKVLISALLVFCFAQTVFAGEGSTTINCQSDSGKTKVMAFYSDGGDRTIQLSLKDPVTNAFVTTTYMNAMTKANLELNNSSPELAYPGTRITIGPVIALKRSHFVNIVAIVPELGDETGIELVSLAGSMNLVKGEYGSEKGTFKATVSGQDPRKSANAGYDRYLDNVITVNCSYDYGI